MAKLQSILIINFLLAFDFRFAEAAAFSMFSTIFNRFEGYRQYRFDNLFREPQHLAPVTVTPKVAPQFQPCPRLNRQKTGSQKQQCNFYHNHMQQNPMNQNLQLPQSRIPRSSYKGPARVAANLSSVRVQHRPIQKKQQQNRISVPVEVIPRKKSPSSNLSSDNNTSPTKSNSKNRSSFQNFNLDLPDLGNSNSKTKIYSQYGNSLLSPATDDLDTTAPTSPAYEFDPTSPGTDSYESLESESPKRASFSLDNDMKLKLNQKLRHFYSSNLEENDSENFQDLDSEAKNITAILDSPGDSNTNSSSTSKIESEINEAASEVSTSTSLDTLITKSYSFGSRDVEDMNQIQKSSEKHADFTPKFGYREVFAEPERQPKPHSSSRRDDHDDLVIDTFYSFGLDDDPIHDDATTVKKTLNGQKSLSLASRPSLSLSCRTSTCLKRKKSMNMEPQDFVNKIFRKAEATKTVEEVEKNKESISGRKNPLMISKRNTPSTITKTLESYNPNLTDGSLLATAKDTVKKMLLRVDHDGDKSGPRVDSRLSDKPESKLDLPRPGPKNKIKRVLSLIELERTNSANKTESSTSKIVRESDGRTFKDDRNAKRRRNTPSEYLRKSSAKAEDNYHQQLMVDDAAAKLRQAEIELQAKIDKLEAKKNNIEKQRLLNEAEKQRLSGGKCEERLDLNRQQNPLLMRGIK